MAEMMLKASRMLSALLFVSSLLPWVHGEPQVPCYFIFGDSLFDNGNNNLLLNLAKVNYLPYGIDFSRGPTGRFSNGRNIGDAIAELLGFQGYIPSLNQAIVANNVLQGVNYASGGAGIRNETGRQVVSSDNANCSEQHDLRSLEITKDRNQQQKSFELEAHSKIRENSRVLCVQLWGRDDRMKMRDKREQQYNVEQFAAALIQQYSEQLKIAVMGLGRGGCLPLSLATFGTNGSPCVEMINNAEQIFNNKLISLINNLNANLSDARFTFINLFQIDGESAQGFNITDVGCCKVTSSGLCIPFSSPCSSRTDQQYAYWDSVHPTEARALIIGRRAYVAQEPTDAVPFDIRRLAQL
ncbi:hypothetical protein DKX38_028274 [Salix brachista]|uniref:SGNH hydrolase-type esterase domain-containing protein n=1 Tax=Salix brachista TaxID=2182728 RepID=A0A5N5J551_9ROSI|nr:hypothetical protein DKX38_028274 [Salix brachista]